MKRTLAGRDNSTGDAESNSLRVKPHTVPVPVATASGDSLAPLPTIVAAGAPPASGLASKSLPVSIPDLGVLGRLS